MLFPEQPSVLWLLQVLPGGLTRGMLSNRPNKSSKNSQTNQNYRSGKQAIGHKVWRHMEGLVNKEQVFGWKGTDRTSRPNLQIKSTKTGGQKNNLSAFYLKQKLATSFIVVAHKTPCGITTSLAEIKSWPLFEPLVILSTTDLICHWTIKLLW